MDAPEFIGMIRSRHQLRLAREGRSIDNHAPLAELSPADKTRLRGAFLAVKRMQAAMIGNDGHG